MNAPATLITPSTFSAAVNDHVERGLNVIEAIMSAAEASGLEMETVQSLIRRSPILKAKLHDEAVKLRLLTPD